MLPVRVTLHFTIIFIFVCLHRFAAGGCLNYGHSCWGGHGKRSGLSRQVEGVIPSQTRSTDWYLARLLKTQRDPLDVQSIFGSENVIKGPGYDVINFQPSQNRKARLNGEADLEMDAEDWSQDANESDEVVVVAPPEVRTAPKLHLYQLLNDETLLRKN